MWLPTFGHAADGNVHTHIMKARYVDGQIVPMPEARVAGKIEAGPRELYADGPARGGVISGEHGIGLVKKPFCLCFPPEKQVEVMRGIKRLVDPQRDSQSGQNIRLTAAGCFFGGGGLYCVQIIHVLSAVDLNSAHPPQNNSHKREADANGLPRSMLSWRTSPRCWATCSATWPKTKSISTPSAFSTIRPRLYVKNLNKAVKLFAETQLHRSNSGTFCWSISRIDPALWPN